MVAITTVLILTISHYNQERVVKQQTNQLKQFSTKVNSFYYESNGISWIKLNKQHEIDTLYTTIQQLAITSSSKRETKSQSNYSHNIKKSTQIKQDVEKLKNNSMIVNELSDLFEYETIINHDLSTATLSASTTSKKIKEVKLHINDLHADSLPNPINKLLDESEKLVTYRENFKKKIEALLETNDNIDEITLFLKQAIKESRNLNSPKLEKQALLTINKIKNKAKKLEEERLVLNANNQHSVTDDLEVSDTTEIIENDTTNPETSQTNANPTEDNSMRDESTTENSEATKTPTITEPSQEVEHSPNPIERTDGMNFNGYHFDIKSFNGAGGSHVPTWTPYIYRWSEIPNLYLAEKQSDVGNAVWSLKVGSKIIVDGSTYTVYKYISGVNNQNGDSYELVVSQGAPVTIVTCESNDEWSLQSMWFAK